MNTRFVNLPPLGIIALASLLACGDPTAPEDEERALQGEFLLSSVNGSPLPVLWAVALGAKYFLLSDKMVFDGRGSIYREQVSSWEITATGVNGVNTDTATRYYRIRADTVEIGSFYGEPCPINAVFERSSARPVALPRVGFGVKVCDLPDFGIFTGEEVIVLPGHTGRGDMVFRRRGVD